MNELRRSVLVPLTVCVLACITSQCCRSADGNAKGAHSDLTAGRKSQVSSDPDWDVNITSTVPRTAEYAVSCSNTAYCWLWDATSLWAYDQQHQVRRISVELNENEYILNGFLLSSEVGWIVSSRGLFQTRDGGTNWRKLDTPQFESEKGRIHAVYFMNEKEGWIAGGSYQQPLKGEALPNNALSDDRKRVLIGAVSKTADGGFTWQDTRLERSVGRFDKIIFSGNLGIVSGDAGLKVTTDGGANWKNALSDYSRKDTGERPQVTGAFLFDGRRGWVSLSGAELIATEDAARSWRVIYPSGSSEPDAVSFNEMVFVDERRGLGLRAHLGRAQLYKTSNAGQTWTPMLTDESFSGLGWVPGNSLIVAVSRRGIYSLTRKGR
jgi:photosystem II stability/assembly factor-like uncharacterized protein